MSRKEISVETLGVLLDLDRRGGDSELLREAREGRLVVRRGTGELAVVVYESGKWRLAPVSSRNEPMGGAGAPGRRVGDARRGEQCDARG